MGGTPLDRAPAGDAEGFAELTAPYRRELHLHCYRMLGSLADADDVLQDTLTAAWRGLGSLADPSSLRAWLYRIATNRCLNAIRTEKRRRPPEPRPPFAVPEPSRRQDVTWLQPYPDARLDGLLDESTGPEPTYQRRETVELAFIAALQRLPPRQTAVLLLCDVLGFSTAEVATMLRTTPTAVKGVRQRARGAMHERPSQNGDRRGPTAGSPEELRLARRFADAFVAADVEGVVALLTEDAWLAMPPAPHIYEGPDAIRSFLRASAEWRGTRALRLVPTRANTQPAFAGYLTEPGASVASPAELLLLTLAGDRIRAITRFLDGRLHASFGLPAALG